MIPGLNHNYQSNRTFYALQTDSGLYLSHPEHYREGTGKCEYGYLKHSDGKPEKAYIKTDLALTDKWWCAWITYSLEDLRLVYQYISTRFSQESERPRHPCTGEFVTGKYDMTTISKKGLRRLTSKEINRSRQLVQKKHGLEETASQLKLELTKQYSGAELIQKTLPSIPTQKKSKSIQDGFLLKKIVRRLGSL